MSHDVRVMYSVSWCEEEDRLLTGPAGKKQSQIYHISYLSYLSLDNHMNHMDHMAHMAIWS